jgi:hypothetical protein
MNGGKKKGRLRKNYERGIETPNIPPRALNVFCAKMSTETKAVESMF